MCSPLTRCPFTVSIKPLQLGSKNIKTHATNFQSYTVLSLTAECPTNSLSILETKSLSPQNLYALNIVSHFDLLSNANTTLIQLRAGLIRKPIQIIRTDFILHSRIKIISAIGCTYPIFHSREALGPSGRLFTYFPWVATVTLHTNSQTLVMQMQARKVHAKPSTACEIESLPNFLATFKGVRKKLSPSRTSFCHLRLSKTLVVLYNEFGCSRIYKCESKLR